MASIDQLLEAIGEDREQEREFVLQLKLRFYGKKRHGWKIVRRLIAFSHVQFGGVVKICLQNGEEITDDPSHR